MKRCGNVALHCFWRSASHWAKAEGRLGFELRAGLRLKVGRVGHVGRVGLCLQRMAWCFALGKGWAVIVNGGALR